MYYGIRAKSKDILAWLLTKAHDAGDLYKPIEMKKCYSDWSEKDTFVCLQYLEGKGLINGEKKNGSYFITLTVNAVDFVEPTP